jgi:hypothetical protein
LEQATTTLQRCPQHKGTTVLTGFRHHQWAPLLSWLANMETLCVVSGGDVGFRIVVVAICLLCASRVVVLAVQRFFTRPTIR